MAYLPDNFRPSGGGGSRHLSKNKQSKIVELHSGVRWPLPARNCWDFRGNTLLVIWGCFAII